MLHELGVRGLLIALAAAICVNAEIRSAAAAVTAVRILRRVRSMTTALMAGGPIYSGLDRMDNLLRLIFRSSVADPRATSLIVARRACAITGPHRSKQAHWGAALGASATPTRPFRRKPPVPKLIGKVGSGSPSGSSKCTNGSAASDAKRTCGKARCVLSDEGRGRILAPRLGLTTTDIEELYGSPEYRVDYVFNGQPSSHAVYKVSETGTFTALTFVDGVVTELEDLGRMPNDPSFQGR
jgi:hypothetical protein